MAIMAGLPMQQQVTIRPGTLLKLCLIRWASWNKLPQYRNSMVKPPFKYNNFYILRISFISALGGYLFGFDFAVISGALPFLRKAFQLSSWWEGFLTGSLALGCIA